MVSVVLVGSVEMVGDSVELAAVVEAEAVVEAKVVEVVVVVVVLAPSAGPSHVLLQLIGYPSTTEPSTTKA